MFVETLTFSGSSSLGLRLTTTMPSADFCPFITSPIDDTSPFGQTGRSPQVLRCYFPPIRSSHIHTHFSSGIGLCIFVPTRPDMYASYALPVRRAGNLHSASSGHHFTMIPLRFRYWFLSARSTEDFHLLVAAPCRAHTRSMDP